MKAEKVNNKQNNKNRPIKLFFKNLYEAMMIKLSKTLEQYDNKYCQE